MLLAEKDEPIDNINDLPLSVLFHILESMDVKHAVQTCVLSKQWKELWKGMATFSMKSTRFKRVIDFNKFVSQFLSLRDSSISLSKVEVVLHRSSHVKKLNRIITYAALHHVQQMSLHLCFYMLDSKFPSFNLPCSSLVYLHLTHKHFCHPVLKFPNFLLLPALEVLHLENLCFSASYSDYAEPFRVITRCKLWSLKIVLYTNLIPKNCSYLIIIFPVSVCTIWTEHLTNFFFRLQFLVF